MSTGPMKSITINSVAGIIKRHSPPELVAGITPHPDDPWMTQIVRKITYVGDGFRLGKRYSKTDSQ